MKIVFFGSSKFACAAFEVLFNSKYKIQAAITQPDKPKGRHQKLSQTPIKMLALKHGIPVYQPLNLKSQEFLKSLKEFNADVFVIVAYGKILTDEILETPRVMPINLHASLLPKYRGAAPINAALINGAAKTGVTIMRVTKQLDSGEIIYQEELPINENDTLLTLTEKLAKLGSQAMLKSLDLIAANNFKLIPQDETNATFVPKIKKINGRINWNKTSDEIFNQWRGCLGWPGVYTFYNKKHLKLISLEIDKSLAGEPGKIIDISKKGIVVAAKENAILIKELQPEAKRVMTSQEFIQGHRLKIGDSLG